MGRDLYHSTALIEAAKKFSALKCKKTWQSTVPKTSAKVYGTWHNYTCIINMKRL